MIAPDPELIKTEFHYLSTVLLCGEKSVSASRFKIYDLDIFKKHKDLGVRTHTRVDSELRVLKLNPNEKFYTFASASGICTHITYRRVSPMILVSDLIFSDDECETCGNDTEVLFNRKIKAVGRLIQAFYLKELSQIPLLINDFPEISRRVLSDPLLIS